MVAELNQKQQALEERLAWHKKAGHVPKTSFNQKNDGLQAEPRIPQNRTQMPSTPAPRKLHLDEKAITPWMVSEIAKTTSLADLRLMFESEKDVDRRGWLYQEITKRRQQS